MTEKYGLYIAPGKENVNRQQLRNPDKIKYEIYDAIKAALPHCANWDDLQKQLKKNGITIVYKFKGNTEIKEGVIFSKDGQSFSGSKVDRQFSYSKLDAALNGNVRRHEMQVQEPTIVRAENPKHSDHFGLGGLFDIKPGSDYDENEVEFRRQQRRKKKKKGKSRGI